MPRRALRSTEFALLETCAKPVCLVCACARASSRSYLAGVLKDGVNDPTLRADWRRRGGLCERHWTVLRSLESPALPSTILTTDLLRTYLQNGQPDPVDCPACAAERKAERSYREALETLPLERLAPALEQGRAFLCLTHLRAVRDEERRALFRARLEALLDELSEFERKQDYRFRDEPVGAERDSWIRAIRALGGEA